MNEEEYKKTLAENGVDLPKDSEGDEPDEQPEVAPKDDSEKKLPKDEQPKDEPPKEERKRSIYDEYKEKKAELKSEKELREQAERERDEWKAKVDAYESADNPSERKIAADDLESFAKEIGADPEAIKKMQQLFLKDIKPEIDPSLKKDMEDFKKWKSANQSVIEKQLFETEFTAVVPTIKEFFPSVREEELKTIKEKVDTIAHSKEWHDKPLDFIVFKNRDTLSKLVSPKRKGMEGNNRIDTGVDENPSDFDPNADLTSMSPKQRAAWEEGYRNAVKAAEQGVNSSGGKKILI